ncbi:DUF7541 family protein [Natronomonas halophila]|uniref:DUF7541 family protein n=1 Tax=Natronomonas halophila TaxID=2747817 RepID=UPI001FEC48FB|nr:cox cluster protein [Natronomonas halophila]
MEAEPEPGVSERYEKTSAWPLVVAFGLVLSEIGILFNLYPVAVGGLVMFVASIAGIVNEAGYVTRPWRLLAGLGVTLAVVGMLVVSTQVDGGLSAYIAQASMSNQISQRGFTIAATGVVVVVAGLVAPRVLNQ